MLVSELGGRACQRSVSELGGRACQMLVSENPNYKCTLFDFDGKVNEIGAHAQ